MAIKALNPYLNFNGNAQQAIDLYRSALGAQVGDLMRFGDVPGMDMPAEHKGRVMHAKLDIGAGMLMISDTPPGKAATVGTNQYVCLDFTDAADLTKKFDALAVGGTVTMAPHDTFWGAKFGMLTDAFGISWMFNCQQKQA